MTQLNKRTEQLFLAGMIASMFSWGLSWSSGKILSAYGDPFTIAAYRFICTFLSLLPILLLLKQSIRLQGAWQLNLSACIVLMSLYSYFFLQGLSKGYAGAGGILVTTLNPILSYIIGLVLDKRRPTAIEWLGLFIGLLAGLILLDIWNQGDQLLVSGNIYFVLATITWAVLSLFTAQANRFGSPIVFSLWMYLGCSFSTFILGGWKAFEHTLHLSDQVFWFNLFYSGTITTAGATTYFFYATTKIGASKASTFIFLVPLSAGLGAWLFLDEQLYLHSIIGGILGIVAILVLNRCKPLKKTSKT